MNFEKLLNEEKIEKVEKKEFSDSFVQKSLDFAKKGLETENYNEAMSIAYNTVFRVCNRLMNLLGYRAIGKEHHKHLFEFLLQAGLDKKLINYFDNIRIKRNNFIYRDIENISREEAGEIIKKAGEFVQKIRTFVHKKRTEVNNE